MIVSSSMGRIVERAAMRSGPSVSSFYAAAANQNFLTWPSTDAIRVSPLLVDSRPRQRVVDRVEDLPFVLRQFHGLSGSCLM